MEKNMIVKYVEVMDSKNPKHPDLNVVAQELSKRIKDLERENNINLFQVLYLGEGFKPMDEISQDIKFSVPYDKVWKFMLLFR